MDREEKKLFIKEILTKISNSMAETKLSLGVNFLLTNTAKAMDSDNDQVVNEVYTILKDLELKGIFNE